MLSLTISVLMAAAPGAASPEVTWTAHYGLNCYDGHGGTGPTDPVSHHLSTAQCEAQCSAAALGGGGCVAIVRNGGSSAGACWLR